MRIHWHPPGPHGPMTVTRTWYPRLFRIERLDEPMCKDTSACGCTSSHAPATAAAADIGGGIFKGVMGLVGGAIVLTLVVRAVMFLAPWLIVAGSLAAAWYGTALVVRVRRRLAARRARVVTAPRYQAAEVPAPDFDELAPPVQAALRAGILTPEDWEQPAAIQGRLVTRKVRP